MIKRAFVFCLFFFFPLVSLASEQADFLIPNVTGVKSSLWCQTKIKCQTLLFIQGERFLNSNGGPGVFVGNEWANVIRATDNQIVAIASARHVGKTPIVTINTTINRPVLESEDPVLENMFNEAVEVALSSIRLTKEKKRYLRAGPNYDDPPRVYYRDTYWASGMILLIEPSVIRDQILLLARGINSDGSVPSAIPVDPKERMIPLWIDHHDSGQYFIMLVYDYIRFTGNASILEEYMNGRTIFSAINDILTHLALLDTNGNLLPEKPKNSTQDWLDTIPRSGEVLSNEVLYYEALREMAELSARYGKESYMNSFAKRAVLVRYQINKRFWNDEKGMYFESCENGACVDRLTNESSLAILYDVIPVEKRDRFFKNLLSLESRRNPEILFGDWGVVNAFPAYAGSRAYMYQNMTDWPFLDAINAGARLKYGNVDWYYPLTRWWTYFDATRENGQLLPEFVSPIDKTAGNIQAWSVAPIVSYIRYGLGIDPGLDGKYTRKTSVDKKSVLKGIVLRGKRVIIE